MAKSENTAISNMMRDTESLSMTALSIVLIGPDEERCRAVAKAFAGPQATIALELPRYPQLDDLADLIQGDYDAALVDLDPNPERALDIVESLCSKNRSLTVMVYSAQSDAELLVRCMRAGAREYLTEPVLPSSAGEALVRASARRDETQRHKAVAAGKLLVFAGSKGGCGVTTVASNFAVALARHGKVALIDLDLELGDAALTLGLTTKFTALDAIGNLHRLDSDFFSGLLAKHASGLAVLGALNAIPPERPSRAGMDRLLSVARESFDYVVADAGSRSIDMYPTLFDLASRVYLIAQVGVADLRNANRFVTRYFTGADGGKLEIVLNRYAFRNIEIDDAAVTRALTRPAKWKIPDDSVAARRALNTGVSLAADKNPIAAALADMASAASGQTPPEKKRKFSLFG
jgi:pilus assembly protein CpaE